MLSPPTPPTPHRKIAPYAPILRLVYAPGAKMRENTNDAEKGTISLSGGGYSPDKTGVCGSSLQWPTTYDFPMLGNEVVDNLFFDM